VCSLCGTQALGRRGTAAGEPMCFRCRATRLVDTTLAGADGRVPDGMTTLRDAIVAMDNPRSTLASLTASKSMTVLGSIARGEQPLSHQTLDNNPSRSVEHLRALLVAAGALPARDEHLARLHRFADHLAAGIDHADDRHLVAAFARWHVLARARARDRDLSPTVAYRCRAELTAAAPVPGVPARPLPAAVHLPPVRHRHLVRQPA
jgi:hypothetical protein